MDAVDPMIANLNRVMREYVLSGVRGTNGLLARQLAALANGRDTVSVKVHTVQAKAAMKNHV